MDATSPCATAALPSSRPPGRTFHTPCLASLARLRSRGPATCPFEDLLELKRPSSAAYPGAARKRCLEDEVEGGSLAYRPFGPGPSAMPVDDPADSGQADACARELALAVEPLEGSEELVSVDHVEADPVVAH